MNFKETVCSVDWIHLAQDRGMFRAERMAALGAESEWWQNEYFK
jgi:hypothetical protein